MIKMCLKFNFENSHDIFAIGKPLQMYSFVNTISKKDWVGYQMGKSIFTDSCTIMAVEEDKQFLLPVLLNQFCEQKKFATSLLRIVEFRNYFI